MPTKLYKYELWLKPEKCRSCQYISDYCRAVDFWSAVLYIYKFWKKRGVIKPLQYKITEVSVENPLEKIKEFKC